MPFGESISPSYGTHNSSSSDGTRQRHSGGAGFVSPSFDEFPYPPYSEMPYTSLKRKKNGNQFVKWAMRAVLASPVIVLCLWSLGAVLFSSRTTATQGQRATRNINNNSRARRMSNSNTKTKIQVGYMQPQNGGPMMSQQTPQNQLLVPVQLLSQLPVVPPNMGNTIPIIPPMGSTQQQQQQQMFPEVSEAQPAMPVTAAAIPATQLAAPATNEGLVAMAPPQQQLAPALETPPAAAATSLVQQQSDYSATGQQIAAEPALQLQPQPLTSTQPQQQVLYYDPKQTTPKGMPPVVYDASGIPVEWNALQGRRIFLEPQQQQMALPKQQLATTSIKKWGESTSQDQSIIVATVAVMALLVGAFSARRLRARTLLSACIENETLEDDVAYDTAYTTTDNSYNTFGGWKGDLEKFDV